MPKTWYGWENIPGEKHKEWALCPCGAVLICKHLGFLATTPVWEMTHTKGDRIVSDIGGMTHKNYPAFTRFFNPLYDSMSDCAHRLCLLAQPREDWPEWLVEDEAWRERDGYTQTRQNILSRCHVRYDGGEPFRYPEYSSRGTV